MIIRPAQCNVESIDRDDINTKVNTESVSLHFELRVKQTGAR